MKIASWNVNSIRARQAHVLQWLAVHPIDVLCLQETKVRDDMFPREEFEEQGLHVYAHGQSAYNGVAFLSRVPLEDVTHGLPKEAGLGDQARLITARIGDVRLFNLYAPNGDNPESEKFLYKEKWYAALAAMLDTHFKPSDKILLCGDFNIAPEDRDVHSPEAARGKCMFHPLEHEWLGHLISWGLVDAFRLFHQEGGLYSWWDYRQNNFQRNRGMRIDLVLLSTGLTAACRGVEIDAVPRSWEKPSDHVPVIAELF